MQNRQKKAVDDNGRLYARMENGEEILITRRYAKEIENCFMEDEDDERI